MSYQQVEGLTSVTKELLKHIFILVLIYFQQQVVDVAITGVGIQTKYYKKDLVNDKGDIIY